MRKPVYTFERDLYCGSAHGAPARLFFQGIAEISAENARGPDFLLAQHDLFSEPRDRN